MIAIEDAKKTSKQFRFVSLENYLNREERSVHKHEYYNGKIVAMPGAKFRHNQIAAQIMAAIITEIEDLETTYIVCNSDMKIYIPLENHALYPDAVVVCEAPEYWNGREDIILNPILVVEVLSKSTEKYDRGDKFFKYKSLPSFKEYVLVKQERSHVESWYRESAGRWQETVVNDLAQSIHLASLGVDIDLKKYIKT